MKHTTNNWVKKINQLKFNEFFNSKYRSLVEPDPKGVRTHILYSTGLHQTCTKKIGGSTSDKVEHRLSGISIKEVIVSC